MKLLSFVARPYPLESPSSILIRTAQGNGYLDVNHLCRALKIPRHNRLVDTRLADQPLFNLLCEEAPPLAADLRSAFYLSLGTYFTRGGYVRIQGGDFPIRSLRNIYCACPACLKLGYSRNPQDFSFYEYCPYHKVELIKACPACHQVNRWKEMLGFSCKRCGFLFCNANPTLYDPPRCISITSSFGEAGASVVLNKYQSEESLRSQLEPLSIAEIIPTDTIKSEIQRAISADLKLYPKLPLSAYEAAWSSVKNGSFRKHALNYLNEPVAHKHTCGRANCCSSIELSIAELGYAIAGGTSRTRQLLDDQRFIIHRGKYNNINFYSHPQLCDVISKALDKKSIHTTNQYTRGYVSARQAATLLETNTTAVSAAVKRGLFSHVIKGDRINFIPRASIAEFKEKYIFATELAKKFKLSCKTMTCLAERAKLKLAYNRSNEYEPCIYLRKDIKLTQIRHEIDARRVKKSRTSHSSIKIKSISKKTDIEATVLIEILRSHCACAHPLKQITPAERNKLSHWLRDHITIHAAATNLHTTTQQINTRFIHSNLITHVDISRTRFLLTKDIPFITEHLAKYMSCAQAAMLWSLREVKVREMANKGLIASITVIYPDNRRQVLIQT